MIKVMSGEDIIRGFNYQPGPAEAHITLEEYIDIAIEMAVKDAIDQQVIACIEQVKRCEDTGYKRIRLNEALGACCSAKIKFGEQVTY